MVDRVNTQRMPVESTNPGIKQPQCAGNRIDLNISKGEKITKFRPSQKKLADQHLNAEIDDYPELRYPLIFMHIEPYNSITLRISK